MMRMTKVFHDLEMIILFDNEVKVETEYEVIPFDYLFENFKFDYDKVMIDDDFSEIKEILKCLKENKENCRYRKRRENDYEIFLDFLNCEDCE